MRYRLFLTGALLAAAVAVPAYAGTCRTDGGQTCPSQMPPGGYCECNVHGQNVDGTIVSGNSKKGTAAKPFQPDAPGEKQTQSPGGQRPPPPGAAPQ